MQQFLRPLAVVVASAVATSQQAPPAQTPPLKTETTAILVDVSVLDRKGQPVRDLRLEDFELKENGVRQQLTSARLIQVARPPAPNAAPSSAVSQPSSTATPSSLSAATPVMTLPSPLPENVSVTAILFDRLTPEMRPLARRAALAYIATLPPQIGYAGLFMGDLSLVTFAPFTNDPEVLRTALDRLAMATPSNMRPEAPDPRVSRLLPETPVTAGADTPAGYAGLPELIRGGTGYSSGREPAVEVALLAMMVRMEKAYRAMLDEMNGQASVAALRATVESLRSLEGRKTILYFSDALPITSRTKSWFEELIVAANSANVTINTVDAAGLRVHSQELTTSQEIGVAGAQGIGDINRDKGPWTKELERQEQVVSSRAAAVLGRLANETGGFLVANTNDLSAGVPRMQTERDTYYLLTYQPSNMTLDGKFRQLSVKVNRPQVTVKARKGYAATPPVAPR
jgi:VWFA-related protein